MATLDYKDTLHLPETDFSMKADLAKREPAWLASWEAAKLYEVIQASRQGCPSFILHDGPPYANGDLHVGHAINKILKDILLKVHVLAGYAAPYVPGWDCHGLPIELIVEKKKGRVGRQLTPAVFRAECRAYAQSQIESQRAAFKRLGVLGDWNHPYVTMDSRYEADEIRALAQLYKSGYLKQGYKPIHWCLDCASSLAEAEVEYQDKTSHSVVVKFEMVQPVNALHLKEYVLIWTTTPWTLPANMAVCAGEKIIYTLVKWNGACYWIAKERLETIFEEENVRILHSCTGAELTAYSLRHCFEDRRVPVLVGDHVTLDAGTGFVHTAPAHGVEDYQVWCRVENRPFLNPVMSNGCYTPETPFFAGVHVSKANAPVIEKLEAVGALFKQALIQHSYPHCWRHKTPLIFRATSQWFVAMDGLNALSQAAQTALNQVQFIPEEGQARLRAMLDHRPDWCISRQRTWGVPIPFFIDKISGKVHPETNRLLSEIADAVEKGGLEAWFDATPERFGVDSTQYEPLRDILDVWFDSGLSHDCVLARRPELADPADLYLEGSDQHRGWFQTSLLTSVALKGRAPYRQILTHGFVVDGEGRKMSKSIGNVITPAEVISEYGADILRLWVATSDYRNEIAISKSILKQTADMYRKIRNTFRYLLAALKDFDPRELDPCVCTIEMDRFMMNQAYELQASMRSLLTAEGGYQIRAAVMQFYAFCEEDLSSVYFDVLKDRLYTENSPHRMSAQYALYVILNVLVRLISPILSFTADEVWQAMRAAGWLMDEEATPFTAHFLPPLPADPALTPWQNHWSRLTSLRAGINKQLDQMRKKGEMGSSLEVVLTLNTQALEPWIVELAQSGELRYFLIVSACQLSDHDAIVLSPYSKCERCWHHDVSVGQHLTHSTLCARCVENVEGSRGKTRQYF